MAGQRARAAECDRTRSHLERPRAGPERPWHAGGALERSSRCGGISLERARSVGIYPARMQVEQECRSGKNGHLLQDPAEQDPRSRAGLTVLHLLPQGDHLLHVMAGVDHVEFSPLLHLQRPSTGWSAILIFVPSLDSHALMASSISARFLRIV